MTENLIVALLTAVISIGGTWALIRKAQIDNASLDKKTKEDAAAVVETARIAAKATAEKLYADLCEDLMESNKDLREQVRAAEKQQRDDSERITALEQQGRAAAMQIAQLNEANDRVTRALEGAQEQIEALERENADLRAMLKALNKTPPPRATARPRA